MTAAAPSEAPRSGDLDLTGRLFSAVEVLVSTHAERAQREASDDAKRVLSGVVLVVVAGLLLLPVVLLVDVALAVVLVEQASFGLASSLGMVALANLLVALGALSSGRSRLKVPVMKETRATLKKAAQVLRG